MLSVTVPGEKRGEMKTPASCENCRWLCIEVENGEVKAYCRQIRKYFDVIGGWQMDFICDFYDKGSKGFHGWKREEMERIKRSSEVASDRKERK